MNTVEQLSNLINSWTKILLDYQYQLLAIGVTIFFIRMWFPVIKNGQIGDFGVVKKVILYSLIYSVGVLSFGTIQQGFKSIPLEMAEEMNIGEKNLTRSYAKYVFEVEKSVKNHPKKYVVVGVDWKATWIQFLSFSSILMLMFAEAATLLFGKFQDFYLLLLLAVSPVGLAVGGMNFVTVNAKVGLWSLPQALIYSVSVNVMDKQFVEGVDTSELFMDSFFVLCISIVLILQAPNIANKILTTSSEFGMSMQNHLDSAAKRTNKRTDPKRLAKNASDLGNMVRRVLPK